MKERLEAIKKAALEKIEQADAMDSLNDIRVSVLGKKGELTQVLKGMKDVAKEERPIVGQMVNDTRAVIEEALEKEMTLLKKKVREEKMKREVIDVTLPGKTHEKGHRHPNQIALEDLERVFIGMGYEVVEGPEVEYDKYNFEMLNIPANHPAKDEQDTFYINKDIVLRTQTSPVQARIMETGKMPIRMIAPGRVFRSDEVDATHSPSFHQVEGLVVDKGITFADLKGTLEQFAKEFFGPDTKVKFRPHHFPFTEPSAEVDVSCFKCGGNIFCCIEIIRLGSFVSVEFLTVTAVKFKYFSCKCFIKYFKRHAFKSVFKFHNYSPSVVTAVFFFLLLRSSLKNVVSISEHSSSHTPLVISHW